MHNLASNKFQFLSVYTFIYMVPEQSDLYFIWQGGSWINLVYIFYGKAFSALLVVWCPPYFRYLLYVAAYISFFG